MDTLAEQSKAVAQGAIPKGHGFETTQVSLDLMRSVQQCKCASVTFRRPIEPKRSSLHSAECGRAETRVARMRAEYINQLDYSRSAFNFITEAHHAERDANKRGRERESNPRGETQSA